MKSFDKYLVNEGLRDIGKRTVKLKKVTNSHKHKLIRGTNRKSLRQVPKSQEDGVKPPFRSPGLADFVRKLDTSNKLIDVAKKAPTGVWKISKAQVMDVAKKYKFNIPDKAKPMKHLGSTGIQMIRYKPGVYYLYKPRRKTRKKRMSTAQGTVGNFQMGMGA